MEPQTAQSYASMCGTKYNPIAVEMVKKMAEKGLRFQEAKETLRDAEFLLEKMTLTVEGFGDLLKTS